MDDLASGDPNIQAAMLEVISECISGGLLVYDRHDLILFASRQLLNFLAVPAYHLAPGTRLRDFLAAAYDAGGSFSPNIAGSTSIPPRPTSREAWIAEQISSLWKERIETVHHHRDDRWLSFSNRRLPSGYGVCVIRDISDHRKREDQWRADIERVRITEDVLDNLPFAVTVRDSALVYVAVNKHAAAEMGLEPDAILGRKGGEVLASQEARRRDAEDREILASGEAVSMRERIRRHDGSEDIRIVSKYRIGKPGRYYLVKAVSDRGGYLEAARTDHDQSAIMGMPDAEAVFLDEEMVDETLPQDEPGYANRKALVLASSIEDEATVLACLSGLGIAASAVAGPHELRLFLQTAREANLGIDLVIILGESLADEACRVTQDFGVGHLVLDARCLQSTIAKKSDLQKILAEQIEIRFRAAAHQPVTMAKGESALSAGGPSRVDILVAEDNEVNQIVFSQILEGLGHSYVIARDGEEAVSLWQKMRPRLILMDVSLPKLTGFEASIRIRAAETIDYSIPIIGVLAQAFDHDRDECYAAGMNDAILKPISPEAIEALFKIYLEPLRHEFSGFSAAVRSKFR